MIPIGVEVEEEIAVGGSETLDSDDLVPTKPIILRTQVEKRTNYSLYREDLRWDFWYSCAYCSMSEAEADGIGFEIDHYFPQKSRPDLVSDYGNLFYSCSGCNKRKLGFTPSSPDHRIYRIDKEDPRDHIDTKDGIFLEAKTQIGECSIKRLGLNRKTLTRLREIRNRITRATGLVVGGVHDLLSVGLDQVQPYHRTFFNQLKRHLAEKERRLTETVENFVRDRVKSDLLDAAREDKSKPIREYLEENGALVPHR